MSLWEKMRCARTECGHPRHLHRKGGGNVGRTLGVDASPSLKKENAPVQDSKSEPEFSEKEWALINRIHSAFPYLCISHNQIADIIWMWENESVE